MTAFAPGTISLRLYPHVLPPVEKLDELQAQAALAVEHGFDGVLVSERHGGAWGQVPNPLQLCGWLLGAMPHGWAAPAPMLLPLRSPAVVAEEVAWLAARHPGRVGAGFASGGNREDFEATGVDFDHRARSFDAALRAVVAFLRGSHPTTLDGDPAIERAQREPVPLLSAALSPGAVRRAAELGIGIIDSSLPSLARIAELDGAYRRAGGTGPHVLIRRAWLGTPPTDQIRRQLDAYRAHGGDGASVAAREDQLCVGDDPADVAAQLTDAVARSGADALNVRIHVWGIEPALAREQIIAMGDEVLPRVREASHWGRQGAGSGS